MALLEFYCEPCKRRFEQISSSDDPTRGQCPHCEGKETKRLISVFAVGGQGDLRESTLHGCHDHDHLTGDRYDGSGGEDHSHEHSHDHGSGHDHD
ncbi:MAG TPA: zinc ribbon domain-containing protein [Bdellovibrionota bacterium]|nr:zinc ribbon domain-containing protein [Bdellovibrionota bacterium]